MLEIFLLPLLGLQAAPIEVASMEEPLRIEKAWVREAPPGADVLAAYALFCNDNAFAVTLASARSENFDAVEMHVVIEKDGKVEMEQSNSVVIGPTDCVAFEPGARHFMLFDPHAPLRAGDDVEFTFLLADGQEIEAVFPVRRADDMMNGHHH